MDIELVDSAIFDLDGTLWDSSAPSARGWNRALRDLDIDFREIKPEDIRSLSGKTPEEFLPIIFPEWDDEIRKNVYTLCSRYEIEEIRSSGGDLFPDVKEGLERLAESIPVFIVSNCQADYMEAFLDWSGIGDIVFDYISYGESMTDKASNISAIVKRNDLRHPVYIGDTDQDRYSADKAGVPFIHAGYGFGYIEVPSISKGSFPEIEKYLADRFVEYPSKPSLKGFHELF
ncbi:MAG: HAD family hydrolase [Thermoplasmatota archaeon]